jgi:hypothetical protein
LVGVNAKLDQAFNAFDAINNADPNTFTWQGQA